MPNGSPTSLTPKSRAMRICIAAHESWAHTADPTTLTPERTFRTTSIHQAWVTLAEFQVSSVQRAQP